MFFLFFFLFGSLGYLWQDAIDAAINKPDNIPFPVIVNLLLYAFFCALSGNLFGYIFFWLSGKVKPLHQIRFINISLLFCLVLLSSIIIAKPFYESYKLFNPKKNKSKTKGIIRNEIGLHQIEFSDSPINKLKSFSECMAFDIRDTLDVFADGVNTITVRQTATSEFYTYKLEYDHISDVKATLVKTHKGQKYLLVLAMMQPITGYSILLVFNKYGQCVYEELFTNFYYGMSKNSKNEILMSRQKITSDSIVYVPTSVFKF